MSLLTPMSNSSEKYSDQNLNEYEIARKRAHYSEVAERYEDMCEDIYEVVKLAKKNNQSITINERNMFSSAFKNVLSKLRNSWRILNGEKEKHSNDKQIINEKIDKVAKDILYQTNKALNIIKEYMMVDITNDNIQKYIFMKKMVGDYYRYQAEVLSGDKELEVREKAKQSYEEGMAVINQLSATDPVRLGLYLNVSVFQYEIMNDADEACKIAKDGFEKAIGDLDSLNEEHYKDSTLILQLLRDNLTLWTARNDSVENKQHEK